MHVAVQVGPDTDAPPAETVFVASPGEKNGEVVLRWSAPSDDAAGGGPVCQYGIRRSTVPLTESNWATAEKVADEPLPLDPLSYHTMTLVGVPTKQRWYYGIKAVDKVGNWSPLSNVPSLYDPGMRPNPDGYSFPNYGDLFPLASGDYAQADMQRMFGDDAVCWMVGTEYLLKPTAAAWLGYASTKLVGGHCEGMATSSLRFFQQIDSHPGIATPYALSKGDVIDARDWQRGSYQTTVRRNIAYNHLKQHTDPVKTYSRDKAKAYHRQS